jgi:hypothetical protein
MPYPYDVDDLAAIDDLTQANNNPYNSGTNPWGIKRGGHRQILITLLNAAARAANAIASAADSAADYAGRMSGTSTSSVTIGTGSKTFTTQADKFFEDGRWVNAIYDENNYVIGIVTSYVGTTLTINVTKAVGSGSHNAWSIYASNQPGSDGAPGAAGGTGPAGRMAGIPMVYDGTGYTQIDPGTAKIRRNSATPALVDRLYISETASDGKGVASWWSGASSGTSTKRGRIDIFDEDNPANFLSYDVTGALVDHGGYDELVVTYRDHGGTMSNGVALVVQVVDGADKGDQGIQGIPGADGQDGALCWVRHWCLLLCVVGVWRGGRWRVTGRPAVVAIFEDALDAKPRRAWHGRRRGHRVV